MRFIIFLLTLFLFACTQAAPVVETAVVYQPDRIEVDLDAIPALDTSNAIVPLNEIYFDTFQRINRAVPLDRADEALILRLRDAIPPLYNPKFVTAIDGDKFLSDRDWVIGYADGEEAFAYPVKIMNYHEIVRQEVNGRSILITYCPLCRSGVVYDPTIDGEPLLFGNTSALYESDMVMLDHQTGSYWAQVSGQALVGPLAGTQLTLLPSQTTTWSLWLEQHPNSFVLSQDTGYDRNYNSDPFRTYAAGLNQTGQFAFPVSEAANDARLEPGDFVLGIELDEMIRAYPLDMIEDGVVNDRGGETAVVIFVQANSGAAYLAETGGQALTFKFENDRFIDDQTGSEWTMGGTAVSGELVGTQLDPVPSRSTLWFSMIALYPDLILITPK